MVQMFGADNPAYRGGVTTLRTLIRNSKMYKDWKGLVYQRDRYKCVKCGYLGNRKTLECHHINKEFSELLQELLAKYPQYVLPRDEQRLLMLSAAYAPMWSVKNGQTMCKPCHKMEHERLKAELNNEHTISKEPDN